MLERICVPVVAAALGVLAAGCDGNQGGSSSCPQSEPANGSPCSGSATCDYAGCAPPGNTCTCSGGRWECIHTDCFDPDALYPGDATGLDATGLDATGLDATGLDAASPGDA